MQKSGTFKYNKWPNLNGGLCSAILGLLGMLFIWNTYALEENGPGGCDFIQNCEDVPKNGLGSDDLKFYTNLNPVGEILYCATTQAENCKTFGNRYYATDCHSCFADRVLSPVEYEVANCSMIRYLCVLPGCTMEPGVCSGDSGGSIENCTDVRNYCIGGNQTVTTCHACAEGYNLISDTTVSIDGCENIQGFAINKCSKSFTVVDPCEDCISDSNWTFDAVNGVYKITSRECITPPPPSIQYCQETTEWSCPADDYGALTDDGSGSGFSGSCTDCPSLHDVGGKSSVGSNSAVSGCYIPANTTMNDGTGNFVFISNCYDG